MTGPRGRPLPITGRHDPDGVSFALLPSLPRAPFAIEPRAVAILAFAYSGCAVFRVASRQIGKVPRPGDENRRLNAHAASAVPFNGLFPHS